MTAQSARRRAAKPAPPVGKKAARLKPSAGYSLRLFVAGATVRSSQAVLRVRELCATELKGAAKLEVIDIYQQPALARANQIVATPTLIIEFPRPMRRFIGNLSNTTGFFVQLAVSTKGKIKI
ncbi:MAG TPA: circadian clock KaiB family protein [Rariglobus sp.]|jgi:circadian clock protein KaiB|nr:circadian clock KaiB family protein [Rariglobus sp.]